MSRDEGVQSLLADAVTPLETTAPASDSRDLRALGERLGDRRVVGLGEATHGTREFFELKHRIVRHLVTEHGFRLFGIEASFGETLAVNDYVLGGDGDPESVVGDMQFWTWNTEAVREFVEWVRAFNDGRPRGDQVKYYGIDAQFVEASAARLADYLAGAAPSLSEEVAADLAALHDDDFEHGDQDTVRAQVETATRLVDVLGAELDARATRWSGRPTRFGCRWRRRSAPPRCHGRRRRRRGARRGRFDDGRQNPSVAGGARTRPGWSSAPPRRTPSVRGHTPLSPGRDGWQSSAPGNYAVVCRW